jgi:hypothetical protein
VTLNLTTNDTEQGSGVDSMRLKNAGGNWTAWQAYAERKAWKLTRGAGKKTVIFATGSASPPTPTTRRGGLTCR